MSHRESSYDRPARHRQRKVSSSPSGSDPDTRPHRHADVPKRRTATSASGDVDRLSSPPSRRVRGGESPSLPDPSISPSKRRHRSPSASHRRDSDTRSNSPPSWRRGDRSSRSGSNSPGPRRRTDSDSSHGPSRGRRESEIWRRRRDRSPSPPPRRRRSRSRSPSRRNRLHARSRTPPPIRKRRRSRSPSRSPARRSRRPLPSQEESFRSDRRPRGDGDGLALGRPVEKQKPNYNTTGLLARESNTVAGTKVVLKYHEPPDARKPPPSQQWRLYVFKGEDVAQTVLLYTRSCWLIGREPAIADILVEHPSASGQHAVVQFRHKKKKMKVQGEFGDESKEVDVVRPYLIDLESANGTELNGQRIEPARYVEIRDKDMVKIGGSEREYVFMLPPKE